MAATANRLTLKVRIGPPALGVDGARIEAGSTILRAFSMPFRGGPGIRWGTDTSGYLQNA